MKLRKRIIGSMLFLLVGMQVHGADIIEDFRSVTSNVNIAAEGQTSSLGLVKHEGSTYAWGGWNNAPADGTNIQLRYINSGEIQYRGDASLAGSYLLSRFGVTCKLDIIELNKTRSSRKLSFLVRDAATGNWYISDIVDQQAESRAHYSVAEMPWWPVTGGNAELNGDTFVPLSFGDEIAWPDISIDGAGVHCDGEGEGVLEWDIIKFLESGSNQPPEVTAAGALFAYLTEGGVAEVNAVATDDGLPDPPAALTFTWSVLQQPEGATVTFTPFDGPIDPDATGTFHFAQAAFDTVGKYTLQVEVSDGEITATDTIRIDVYPKAFEPITLTPTDDAYTQANAGAETHNNTNLIVNSGNRRRSYIKFDVYGFSGPFYVTGAIKDAKLRLYAVTDIDNTSVYQVSYGPSGEWFEDEITWTNDDLVWGDVLDQEAPITMRTWYQFDVSAMGIGKDGKVTFGLDAPGQLENGIWGAKETPNLDPQLVLLVDEDQAYAPLPLNGEMEIDPRTEFTSLSWYPGAEGAKATSNTVYMSTDPDPFVNPMAGFPQTVAKEAANTSWLELNLSAELDTHTTYYWGVNNGLTESDIWSFTTMKVHPDSPISLTPEDGATDVIIPDVAFTYTTLEGVPANAYHLYVSADPALVEALDESVKIANVHEGYDPDTGIDARGLVDFAPLTTYYYRFEGTDGAGGSWPGAVQSFTTGFFVGLEELENGLTDDQRGVAWTGNVALENDTAVVFRGSASLRLDYAAGTSHATATFTRARDWDNPNMEVLTLFVRGSAANPAATISVTLEDATGATATLATSADATAEDPWQAVNLSLADAGIDRANIKRLDIATDSTGSGTLHVDDIRFYAPIDETQLLGFLVRYPFDADGGDAGVGNLDLTLRGDASIDTADGVKGAGSLRLSGAGLAQRSGDDNLPTVHSALTVSLWLKEDGTMPDKPWKGIFSNGVDNPDQLFSFNLLRAAKNRIRWSIKPNTTPNDRLWYFNGTDGPDTRDGKWHHIVASYEDGVGYKLFVDGLLRVFEEANGHIELPGDGYGLMVGAKDADPSAPLGMMTDRLFSGWIDEIVCYDRVLADAAVDLIYRQGVIIEGDLNGDGVID